MSECCPPTRVVPALVKPGDYTPTGTDINLDGLDAYVAGLEHAGTGKAVVVFADVFGSKSGRHANIADQVAESLKAVVVLPDLFHGDKIEFSDLATPRLGEFIGTWSCEKWQPDMDKVYAYLGEKGNAANVGLMGFCFGAWMIYRESARGAPIKCCVSAHPAWGAEGAHGGTPASLAAQIQHPQLTMPCSDDPEDCHPDKELVQILSKKECAKTNQHHLFTEQNHGFLSQGDLSVEALARDVKVAMDLTQEFMAAHLG